MKSNFTFKLRFYLPFVVSLFYMSSMFSQIEIGALSVTDWKTYYKDSLVQVEYRFDNCNLQYDGINKDEVYLKIQNLKNEKIEISWELVLNYGNRCYNCDRENDELKFNTILEPNQVIEGKCEEGNSFQLKIFSRFLNNESETKLKSFAVKYITSKTVTKE